MQYGFVLHCCDVVALRSNKLYWLSLFVLQRKMASQKHSIAKRFEGHVPSVWYVNDFDFFSLITVIQTNNEVV